MATETAPAVVVTPGAGALSGGGSSTLFTLQLPANSHCSGDTASHGYLVYSYITAADPSTLTFSASGPSSGYSLYDTTGTPFQQESTAINSGNIAQAPGFNYDFFATPAIAATNGDFVITPGTYNVGIACATNTGALDQYWNVQEIFTASASDPNGETWTVVPATQVPESPLTVALPIGALLILGAGVVVLRRRRHSAESLSAA